MNALEQHLTELRVFGYTVVDAVLDADAVDQLRDFVLTTEARIGVETQHRGRARHLANLVALDPMFFALIDHARVLPLIEGIMGRDIILGSLNARVVQPGDPIQSLHSDVPLKLHRYGDDAPLMMNTVWPLHDFTLDNGGTRLVPGSHQSGLQEPPAGFTLQHEYQPLVRAGSVVVINGQTWHAGGANKTAAPRAAMFGHYRYAQWLRFQCDPHDGFNAEWLPQLTRRQRELLRMVNGVDGRHGADFYER